MASSTVENYIKQVYALQFEQGEGGMVGMGDLAASLGVTPGTATSMVKSLAKSNHLEYVPRVGVKLLERGERLALLVLRRHRLIELFLVETLGMEWHEIHEEAETLEHAISDRVLERIDDLLGNPEVDPHGDSIPSASGEIAQRDLVPLEQCRQSQRVTISRIEDQGEGFLQFLESNKLIPGVSITVVGRDSHAGILSVQFSDDSQCSMGFPAARKIQVELCD